MLTTAQTDWLRTHFAYAHTAGEVFEAARTDGSPLTGEPWAVVEATDEADVVRLLSWAQAQRVPIFPRALGSGKTGGALPLPGGVVLTTTRMNRVLAIDPRDFVAEVQPGVITRKLQQDVEARGLFYPPDPAGADEASIGGNVATNAGGMRAVKYGVTADYVLGMRLVLMGGEVLTLGSRCHKDATGLDVKRLVCGSEGTLGVITRLTMKLLPRPAASATLLARFADSHAAARGAEALFATGIIPVACEFIGPRAQVALARYPQVDWTIPSESAPGACLVVGLDGHAATVQAELAAARDALAPHTTHLQMALPPEDDTLWAPRRALSHATKTLGPHKLSSDVTVPRGAVAEATTRFEEIATRHSAFDIAVFGHMGDGNLHVNVLYDRNTPGAHDHAAHAREEIARIACDPHTGLGGIVSGEHGIGLTKLHQLPLHIGTAERDLMHRLKHAFDPHNLLNPGKGY